MKLLITSDVHGKMERLIEVSRLHPDVDLHIDAGDMTMHPSSYQNLSLITVKGNNDYGIDLPYERVIEVEGIKILLTHGHKEMVKFGLSRLKLKAKLLNVQVCIFGHTHQKFVELDEGILFINPGALGDAHRSYATYENQTVTFRGL